MAGEDTNQSSSPTIAPLKSSQMVSSVKLLILKKGEYILWTMKIEQYLAHMDYTLWEVILSCNGVSTEDANQKFLKYLPSARSNISLIISNKPCIDNLDIDDMYNNLKVYEADTKGSSRLSSNSQNVDFVSAKSTSSTNELNAAYSVSTTTCHSSQAQRSSPYADELMFSFFAN
nr:hypothetical protein [Tanacetum cinerariifolium]